VFVCYGLSVREDCKAGRADAGHVDIDDCDVYDSGRRNDLLVKADKDTHTRNITLGSEEELSTARLVRVSWASDVAKIIGDSYDTCVKDITAVAALRFESSVFECRASRRAGFGVIIGSTVSQSETWVMIPGGLAAIVFPALDEYRPWSGGWRSGGSSRVGETNGLCDNSQAGKNTAGSES